MTLFEYYLQYITEIIDGKRTAPEGIDPTKSEELPAQITTMGIPEFVRRCAASDGTELPPEVFEGLSEVSDSCGGMSFFAKSDEEPDEEPTPDPDKDKHAFEVLCDCVALDEGLVEYLAKVLREKDWKEFYKLSQVTTKLDLDPEEFLFWLGNKELYASEEEQRCVAVMDACMERLAGEKQLEVLAALLSGDKATFELFRCEAPELVHLPEATYEWFCRNYLDRDYPLRTILKMQGVSFKH